MDGPIGIDINRLGAWLKAEFSVSPDEIDYRLISAGRSNMSFIVSRSGEPTWVLRRPPLRHVGGSAHDVLREARILTALTSTEVPVPSIYAVCDDEDVLGAPFFLMGFVPGVAPNAPTDFETITSAQPGRLESSMARTLASIHRTDLEAVGLGELHREERLLDRQLRRWLGQFERTTRRDVPAVREAHKLLVEQRPERSAIGFTHGDFKPNNLLVAEDASVRAVLDWELCAEGDVLLDIGWLSATWPEDAPGTDLNKLIELYERESGVAVEHLDYYRSFALWKLACIGEGVYSRLLDGAMGDLDASADETGRRVEERAAEALRILRG